MPKKNKNKNKNKKNKKGKINDIASNIPRISAETRERKSSEEKRRHEIFAIDATVEREREKRERSEKKKKKLKTSQ